ncbi:MAG: adenylate/guanylate cyclase domain-containing protein [Aeromicrobium sp.]
MDPVATRYIDREGAALAYQVVGRGPVDVVAFLECVMHLDLAWTDPDMHHLYERGATYSRTVYFQRRGFGLSDRVPYTPTVEQQADDVLAIMDAVGMRRATLVGLFGTCGALALVAAKTPERVSGLIFVNPTSQGVQSSEELHGWTEAEATKFAEGYLHAVTNWGSGSVIDMWDPLQATPHNRRLTALLERCSATPVAAISYYEWMLQIDIQDVLRSVQVPTRVLCFPSSPVPQAATLHVVELLQSGSLHPLPPTPLGASIGQALLPAADHVEEVATGALHSADADRFLGTVLFTDLHSSTELLASVGDAKHRELRTAHERLLRLAVESVGGDLVDVTGDGTLSVFDGPSKAIRCAETICREAEGLGIAVRAGIHTGELERDGINITGLTVHIGARVSAAAGPGEVLVSRTVHDLVVGSGLRFESRGDRELKGVPGIWELFAVTHAHDQSDSFIPEESIQTPLDKAVLQMARKAPRVSRAAMRLGNAVQRRRARAT